MRCNLRILLILTGLWVVFYFLFRFILKLLTKSESAVFLFFFPFVFCNFLIFPAAYFYAYGGVVKTAPLEFLSSLCGSDVLFIVFTFFTTGPFGLLINVKYLLALLG